MEFEDINRGYLAEPRGHDDSLVTAWREGMTGYPLIDASMRCLNATGYINFRSRAMLVKLSDAPSLAGLARGRGLARIAVSRL